MSFIAEKAVKKYRGGGGKRRFWLLFCSKSASEKVFPGIVTARKYSSLGRNLAARTPPVQPVWRPALLPALAGHDAKDIMRSWGLILRKGNHKPPPSIPEAMVGEMRSLGDGLWGSLLPRWFRGTAIVEPL
jgi:hypothetical protein